MRHICHGEYVVLNYIAFDGAERKFFCNYVYELLGRVNSETLDKVGDRNVYGIDK